MSTFRHFPLGTPVPESPHAMCVSLPRLADVVGYEERDPAVMTQLDSGYPRFILHRYLRQLADWIKTEVAALSGRAVFLVASRRGGKAMIEFLGTEAEAVLDELEGCCYVHTSDDPRIRERALKFLQHTGYGPSSRFAEDKLSNLGLISAPQRERLWQRDPSIELRYELARFLGTGRADVVLPCSSGMNAFFAAFQAVRDIQKPRGRKIWVQIGWLYLDTAKILEEFLGEDERLEIVTDVNDLESLRELFADEGPSIAGVVTETPTNPLMQTADIDEVGELCRDQGALFIIDPTMVSAWNFTPFPAADIVVTSLTKYAAHHGDVMAGAVVFNPESPILLDMLARTIARHDPLYKRDLARLSAVVNDVPRVVGKINSNTLRVARWLEEDARVGAVHWAYSRPYKQRYRMLTDSRSAPGAIISIELRGPLEPVYDALRVPKGPSFGTLFTMACPFLYLAHYDLVSTQAGRACLIDNGLNPELLRLSIGTEDADDIIAVLDEALSAGEWR